ncbi:polyketide synthase dehydratase domain-containing protein, partial [Kitasatospora sp. NPDC098652]|uniref:polyketide synthase dehydratase domain-containing protein n=1 Tax=Kitasatospora sp. NPDC098652 TaxID=3364095 RepID=UPI0038246043
TPTTPPTPTPTTTPTHHTPLPTYPFQHHTYWLHPVADSGDFGRHGTGHPLVGGAIELPGSDALVLTGRVSLDAQPWLVDHAVLDTVLLPGTAFLDIAMRAGSEVGCTHAQDITLDNPLLVPEHDTVDLQIQVNSPGDDGNRPFTIHSRLGDAEWIRHATGVLSPEAPPAPPTPQHAAWPPPTATRLPIADLYGQLAERGYTYGPAFRGLRAAWQDADALYAEVELAEDVSEAGFGVHPALLDAVLHVRLATTGDDGDDTDLELPFSWSGVSLHDSGARTLRARVALVDDATIALDVTDANGRPVLTVGALATRPVDPAKLVSSDLAPLALEWVPATTATTTPPTPDILIVRPDDDTTTPHDPIDAAHHLAEQTLTRVQEWLAQDRADDAHLVVVTRGAVSTGRTDPITDLPAATTWGLIRTAQNEHPHTLTLLDHHGDTPDPDTITAALTTGQPQLALRNG